MHKAGQAPEDKQRNEVLPDHAAERGRIKVLDGMRAFAILMVLMYHSAIVFSAPLVVKIGAGELQNIIYNGWVGVDLFFVLSGFLITSQLLHKTLNMRNLNTYAMRRFFRIAPTYYTIVIAALIINFYLIPVFGMQQEITFSWFAQTWAVPLLAHLVFLHDYFGREPSINGLFWSIPVEVKFYFLLPVILFLLARIKAPKGRIIAVAAFFVFYVLGKSFLIYGRYGSDAVHFETFFMEIRSPFHLSLDGLIIGVLCAFILNNPVATAIKPHSLLTNMLFSAGLLLFFITALLPHLTESQALFFDQILMIPICAFSFGLMLIGLVKGCFASTFFENGFLRFFALISYSLYLSHLFLIPFHEYIEEQVCAFIPTPFFCWLAVFLIFLGLCVVLAYGVHRAIERPFLDWSKKRFKYER